jgi:hypothetical protein
MFRGPLLSGHAWPVQSGVNAAVLYGVNSGLRRWFKLRGEDHSDKPTSVYTGLVNELYRIAFHDELVITPSPDALLR